MLRRDLLIGGACLAAFGAAEALRPRRFVSLKGETALSDAIPRRVPGWSSEDNGDIVMPTTPGSLADRLYSDTVTRVYLPLKGNPARDVIMLLVAYGQAQSDLLQLHRPESCYPAVGFRIAHRGLTSIPMGSTTVPAVALTAISGDRTEDILYWTRVGEYLPQTAGDQRRDRLKTAMQGYVGDGVLVRASILRSEPKANFDVLAGFLAELVETTNPRARPLVVGTDRARSLA